MKLREGFVTHMVQDTQMMVAAGKASKYFHGLVRSNETAAFIIDCLKRETTEDEIVDRLLAEYQVSRDVAAKDVHAVLAKLKEIGALA